MDELLIAVPESEYNKLLKDSEKLKLLEDFGVHNWEPYHEAMKRLE